MQKERFDEHKWSLAGKALTGNLDPDEKAEWDDMLRDSNFIEDFELVKKYWIKLDTLPFQQIDTEKDWETVIKKARKQAAPNAKPKFKIPNLYKYAAVALLFTLSTYLILNLKDRESASSTDHSFTTIEAPAGSKTMVTLPDSSKVWLNAGSKVVFNNSFGNNNRKITLVGEAFFDVIKNPVPFRVHTQQYDIAVLGTAFNIQAYPEDEKITTTLVRGSLKVQGLQLANGENEVLLKPQDRLVLRKGNISNPDPGKASSILTIGAGLTLESGVDTEREVAWKDGWLAIQGESLESLATKMERLYDIKINFEDEGLKSFRYTGRIRQLSLEQVLKALELTSPVTFTIEEKTVILRENKATKSKYKSLQTP